MLIREVHSKQSQMYSRTYGMVHRGKGIAQKLQPLPSFILSSRILYLLCRIAAILLTFTQSWEIRSSQFQNKKADAHGCPRFHTQVDTS